MVLSNYLEYSLGILGIIGSLWVFGFLGHWCPKAFLPILTPAVPWENCSLVVVAVQGADVNYYFHWWIWVTIKFSGYIQPSPLADMSMDIG